MSEGTSPEVVIDEVSPENETGIPQDWFNGYMRGNRLWPQTNFGYSIFTTASILETPPREGLALTNSKLSLNQTEDLISLATGIHSKMKVDRKVYPYQIDRLWEMAKNNASSMITDIARVSGELPSNLVNKEEELAYLFSHIDSQAFQFAKRVVTTARDSLSNVDAVRLSSLYFQQYDITLPPTERAKVDQKYKEKLELCGFDSNDTSIDYELKDRCASLVRSMTRKAIEPMFEGKDEELKVSLLALGI